MTFFYPRAGKINKTVEVLNDLIKINSDRIVGYKMALENARGINSNFKEEIKQIISDGIHYREQLAQKTERMNAQTKNGTTGKIYMAWMDLKVAFGNGPQKILVTSFQYNEEIVLHVYNAALNSGDDIEPEIKDLIAEQEAALRKTCELIGNYREAVHASDYQHIYFN